jgi:hypothetical protein
MLHDNARPRVARTVQDTLEGAGPFPGQPGPVMCSTTLIEHQMAVDSARTNTPARGMGIHINVLMCSYWPCTGLISHPRRHS